MISNILNGNALHIPLRDGVVQCCVTSPPYWQLRTYHNINQLGQEDTPQQYVERLLCVTAEVHRVLRDDGVFFLNIADTYAGSGMGSGGSSPLTSNKQISNTGSGYLVGHKKPITRTPGIKNKSLCGIPQRMFIALIDQGWVVRNDIIWRKTNPMTQSAGDRFTCSHEHIFFCVKSRSYYWNKAAVLELAAYDGRNDEVNKGSPKYALAQEFAGDQHDRWPTRNEYGTRMRNRRDVWDISTARYRKAHYATFPESIPEICLLAASKPGDIVADIFSGAGTTWKQAVKLSRQFVGVELNRDYIELSRERTEINMPLPVFIDTRTYERGR